jgi:hypothetical protein
MLALPPVGTSTPTSSKAQAVSADTSFEDLLGSALGAFLTADVPAEADASGEGLGAMLRGQAEMYPVRLSAAVVAAAAGEEETAESEGSSTVPVGRGSQDGEDADTLVEGEPDDGEPGAVRTAGGVTPAPEDGGGVAAGQRTGGVAGRDGEPAGPARPPAATGRESDAPTSGGGSRAVDAVDADVDAEDRAGDERTSTQPRVGARPARPGGAGEGGERAAARAEPVADQPGEQRGLATAKPDVATTEAVRTENPARAEPSSLLSRIVRIAERLEQAPPPRQMTIEIGELRLSVSLRGDNGVRVVAVGDPGQSLDGDWRRDLSDALAERGLDLDQSDHRGDPEGRRQPHQAGGQRQAATSRRPSMPDDALRL